MQYLKENMWEKGVFFLVSTKQGGNLVYRLYANESNRLTSARIKQKHHWGITEWILLESTEILYDYVLGGQKGIISRNISELLNINGTFECILMCCSIL